MKKFRLLLSLGASVVATTTDTCMHEVIVFLKILAQNFVDHEYFEHVH